MSFRLPRKEASERSLAFSYVPDPDADPISTEQSHLEASDINNIMKRYEATGLAPGNSKSPSFGDFSSVDSFHGAMSKVIEAQDSFMALPASLRKRFDNDPGNLIAFLSDDKNRDEAVRLGLVPEKVAPDATLKDVVEAVKATKVVPRKKPTE